MDTAGTVGLRNLGRIIRIVLAVNFVLLILSFIPAFSGIGAKPGLADRLWGNYRLFGWRADVAWMSTSTIFIVVGGIKWIRGRNADKTTAIVCLAWLACFFFYARYIVHHMFG